MRLRYNYVRGSNLVPHLYWQVCVPTVVVLSTLWVPLLSHHFSQKVPPGVEDTVTRQIWLIARALKGYTWEEDVLDRKSLSICVLPGVLCAFFVSIQVVPRSSGAKFRSSSCIEFFYKISVCPSVIGSIFLMKYLSSIIGSGN